MYIDSLKAHKVHITSDMEGLLAEFDFVDSSSQGNTGTLPKISLDKETPLDLTVITSGGYATVPGGVIYLPAKVQSGIKPSVRLLSQFIVPQEEVKFSFDPQTFPKEFYKISLLAREANKPSVPFLTLNTEKNDIKIDPKKNAISTKWGSFYSDEKSKKDETLSKEPSEVQVSLRVHSNPSDKEGTEVLFENQRALVFFDSKERLQPNLVTKVLALKVKGSTTTGAVTTSIDSSVSSPLKVEVQLEKKFQALFFKAYPGLKEASERNDGSVKLVLDGSGGSGSSLSFDAQYAGEGKYPQFEIKADDLLKKITNFPTGGPTEYSVALKFGNETIQIDGPIYVFKENQ